MRIDDPVARIMSVPVYSVRSSQPVSDVRRLIQEHGFHHVPVVDDGVLVGMLSSSDLVGLSVGDLGGRRGRQRGVDERGEQRLEQSNMNVFSNKIIQSGVDAHVVLISNNDICINAPLGSGQCPNDTNPPKYLHVNVGVGSNDALAKILSTHEQWKDAMRPDGKKHVIVVSDDNASGVVASSFHSMFQGVGAVLYGLLLPRDRGHVGCRRLPQVRGGRLLLRDDRGRGEGVQEAGVDDRRGARAAV
jgi:hypothetical protein